MKKLALAIAVSLSVPGSALAANWQIDTSHSSLQFAIRHMMVSNVRGQLGAVKGSVEYKQGVVSNAKIDVTIDVAGIDTRDAKRDGHLRSADFFDTKKYPSARFVSTSLTEKGGKLAIKGKLTLRGVTKEVTLHADKPVNAIKDMMGKWRTAVSATATINRKDFGISWNKTLDAGGVLLSNEVQLQIDIALYTGDKPNA